MTISTISNSRGKTGGSGTARPPQILRIGQNGHFAQGSTLARNGYFRQKRHFFTKQTFRRFPVNQNQKSLTPSLFSVLDPTKSVEGKGGVLAHHPPQNSPKTPKTAKTPKGPPLPENAFSPENANFQKVGRQTPKTPLQTQSWAPTSKCLNNLTKRQ